ncbi:hypothetical protein Pla52o_55190 [Novipirellula galeiformis]|uniref:Chromosome partition protein Smc n=1 Tax=Novipirellula galeiformis TaxID=2528004 RepID=A0A5C6BT58_9BACT|nr:hypothetical protein [Novipirellula galeiformis]TWU14982.1 hypothetical protein Pla52o_55190 [Novipirellula galeiformis]
MTTLFQTLAACGLVIVAFSTSASADTYHHVDQLALQIDRQAKQILSESRHYRHTPEYSHLVADAREMSELADHMHEVAHHRGSLAHLESDLAKLDAQFHHLESLIDQIERRSARGRGHIHGNTAHVKRLLHSIEDNIHHLQADLRSLRTPRYSVQPYTSARPVIGTPYWSGYGARPHSSGFGHARGHHDQHAGEHHGRSRGITIGGGSSRFTIRF